MVDPPLSRLAGVWLPAAALLVATLVDLADPTLLAEHAELLFLLSAIFLGLPHGAVDHLVIARLEGRPLFSARVGATLVGYLALVFATLAIWWWMPVAVFVGFILLTWFHWGQGDNWFQHHEWGARAGLDAIVLAGSLPMLVPLVAHPEVYTEVANAFVAAAGSSVDLAGPIGALRGWAAGLVGLFVVVRLSRVAISGEGFVPVAAETAALVVFFSIVSPVAAIALYFCLWHSTRHIVRLADTVYHEDWRGAASVMTAAIPLTLVSIAGLVALAWWTQGDDLFAIYLALIAALTVPHVVVVSWMDRREGLAPV